MVIKEVLSDNPDLVKFYSDSGFMIRKVGTDECYGEAVELATTTREYEETDIRIDEDDDNGDPSEATESDYIYELQRLGVDL